MASSTDERYKMQIALNGVVPTQTPFQTLMLWVQTGSVKVNSFDLGDFNEYEGNIEFKRLEIVFTNGDTLLCSGYNALWNIVSYGCLTRANQKQTIVDLLQWMEDNLKDGSVDLFKEE
jgi:hypothetical protein